MNKKADFASAFLYWLMPALSFTVVILSFTVVILFFTERVPSFTERVLFFTVTVSSFPMQVTALKYFRLQSLYEKIILSEQKL